MSGESPSPLVLTAPLIPPCAQTECERLTGTIENRSTSPPISAILITAASPASPPPTTIILGFAISIGSTDARFGGFLLRRPRQRQRLAAAGSVPAANTGWRGPPCS